MVNLRKNILKSYDLCTSVLILFLLFCVVILNLLKTVQVVSVIYLFNLILRNVAPGIDGLSANEFLHAEWFSFYSFNYFPGLV